MYNGSNVVEMYFLCTQAHVLKIIAVLPGVTPGLTAFFPAVPPPSTGKVHIPINQWKEKEHKELCTKDFDGWGLEVTYVTSTHIPLTKT